MFQFLPYSWTLRMIPWLEKQIENRIHRLQKSLDDTEHRLHTLRALKTRIQKEMPREKLPW